MHSVLDAPFSRRIELFEARVWRRIHESTAPTVAKTLSVSAQTVGGATALHAPTVDVLALNRVLGAGLKRPLTNTDVDEFIEAFRSVGTRRFFVQLSPFAEPADAHAILERAGFRRYNSWVKLFRPLEEEPQARSDLVVRAMDRPSEDHVRLLMSSFDWPEVLYPWLASAMTAASWRHYGAYDGSQLAAAASMWVEEGLAAFGPAATHPDFRRRGAQSALVARRVRDAIKAGCTLAVTETAEDRPERKGQSFLNVTRLGFQVAYVRPNYLYQFEN
jgi:GNAT superfamily N-acetyltransferase